MLIGSLMCVSFYNVIVQNKNTSPVLALLRGLAGFCDANLQFFFELGKSFEEKNFA